MESPSVEIRRPRDTQGLSASCAGPKSIFKDFNIHQYSIGQLVSAPDQKYPRNPQTSRPSQWHPQPRQPNISPFKRASYRCRHSFELDDNLGHPRVQNHLSQRPIDTKSPNPKLSIRNTQPLSTRRISRWRRPGVLDPFCLLENLAWFLSRCVVSSTAFLLLIVLVLVAVVLFEARPQSALLTSHALNARHSIRGNRAGYPFISRRDYGALLIGNQFTSREIRPATRALAKLLGEFGNPQLKPRQERRSDGWKARYGYPKDNDHKPKDLEPGSSPCSGSNPNPTPNPGTSLNFNSESNSIPNPDPAATHGGCESSLERTITISCISDIHTDRKENLEWVYSSLCSPSTPDAREDVLLVAGDISHRIDLIEETLGVFTSKWKHVFFVPGNHELWVDTAQTEDEKCSWEKLDRIEELCNRLNVSCWNSPKCIEGIWIVPLLSWYDLSLSVNPSAPRGGEKHITTVADIRYWPWGDFTRCRWPSHMEIEYPTRSGRFPSKVAQTMYDKNQDNIRFVAERIRKGHGHTMISMSHFLPRKEMLPDWMKPESDRFNPDWIWSFYEKSAYRFSKVAGSYGIEDQIRELNQALLESPRVKDQHKSHSDGIRHIHVFGHSHRPKDLIVDGIRYVHNPLAKPIERERGLVPFQVRPKELFKVDTLRNSTMHVEASRIVRYWEETGIRVPDRF
ncbi:hypothetical protein AAMO2058_001013800 [Amorphochlora amoebiformis]|mmetsp:Transcript_6476/g.9952  ORF Transcript_6476/g.9952 Transcript_6476/m.9952 type:complete len:682 (-) Transcript_6476:124-2169(-)